MNRLNGQRVYLAGAMDRVADRGATWRDNITPFLENIGVIVFNPIKKPSIIGKEDSETHKLKLKLKRDKNYIELAELMKIIRSVDLRLVDISDFLIVNLDLDVHPCGTYEEIFLANRSKKPVIVHMEQEKHNAPDWLFGTIPHQMIFSTWSEVKDYLTYIHTQPEINHYNRWKFFNI
jgi:nucleoside 2-deoxyribosyltransferase